MKWRFQELPRCGGVNRIEGHCAHRGFPLWYGLAEVQFDKLAR